MSLKTSINEQVKLAMKAREQKRLGTLRLISSSIKQFEVDNRQEMGEEDELRLMDKMLKQRRDSIKQYKKANRQDLVEQEEYEVKLLKEFMPPPFSEEELICLIKANLVPGDSIKTILEKLEIKLLAKAETADVVPLINKVLSA